MTELDGSKKGYTSYGPYKRYLEQFVIQDLGIHLTDQQIEDYYNAGLSVLDVIRNEDPECRIKDAKIVITWEDKYGPGEKTFYKSKASRMFIEKAIKLRKFLTDRI